MSYFVETIPLGYAQFVCHFQLVISPSANKYFIKLMNDNGVPVAFEMKQQSPKRWVLIQPAPPWASQVEHLLSEAIIANEESGASN